MHSIEEPDNNPDITKYLIDRYEMQRGRGGLSIRRRIAGAARGFFGGKAKQEDAEPFERMSAYWPVVLLDVQNNVRPVSKSIVVQAAHRACEHQEVAKMKARKETQ